MANCVVCLAQFCPNDISLVKFTDEDSRNRDKVSCVYRKILRIFCKYFNLPFKQKEKIQEENEILSSFPFCVECRNLVAELCIFHEKSESIHKIIQKTIAKITKKIVQTENDKENWSNSDSLKNGENGQITRNKISYGYRRKILQNFNPRVHLVDCQSQSQNQKKLPIEINLITEIFTDESPLNDDDCHGNSINNDKDVDNENDVHDLNAETSVNSSDESQEVEKDTEKNSSLNLTSILVDENSAREKTRENIMQQIRAKFNTAPQDSPPLENSIQKKFQPSVSKQRRTKQTFLEDKMYSDVIRSLGDGKYLYKNSWPFHIIENQEFFKCDTCQSQFVFCKNHSKKVYERIIRHIRDLHMYPKKLKSQPLKNPEGGIKNSRDVDKNTFEKERKSIEEEMHSGKIKSLGDGKYLYESSWPFHIIENQEVFKCDVCQCQRRFCKSAQEKIYTHIMTHIREEHTNPTAAENDKDGKTSFRFLDKWTFEKMELGFKCGHCPKIYTTIKSMERHIQICHIPGKFKCSKCPHSCRTRGLLNRHRCGWKLKTLQSSNKSYEISPGSGKFVYIGKKQKWGFELINGKFRCSSCPTVTLRRSQMSSHLRLVHEGAEPRNGRVLKMMGNGKFRLFNKWTFDKVELGFQCGHCAKIYKNLGSIKDHMKLWHVTGKFKCSKCPRSLTRSLLKQHGCGWTVGPTHRSLEISPGSGKFIYNGRRQNWDFELINGKFQCSSCPALRKYKKDMADHIRQYHDGLTTHMCDECGKIFSQKLALTKHKLTHLKNGSPDDGRKQPKSKTPCVCPHCQKTYKSSSGLKVHIFRSHKDIVMTTTTQQETEEENGQGNSASVNYPCGKCPRIFTSPVFLKKHEDLHDAIIDCPKCDKKFKSKAEAQAHLDRHNKVFKFFCDVCNKGFLQKWQVARHKETGAHSQKDETVKSKEESAQFKGKTQKGKKKRKKQKESESSEGEEVESASKPESAESESEDSEDATTEED